MNISESQLDQMLKNNPSVKISGAGAVKPMPSNLLPPPEREKPLKRKSGAMNKTEGEYQRMLSLEFPGAFVLFEGFTFNMPNGHKYTPDFVINNGRTIMCVEVKARGKNGYRLPSYQRAKLAFDQCRNDYPQFTWRWSEKSQGTWNVKDY